MRIITARPMTRKERKIYVAKVFPTEEAVNEALRSLMHLAQKSVGLTKRSTGHSKKLHVG